LVAHQQKEAHMKRSTFIGAMVTAVALIGGCREQVPPEYPQPPLPPFAPTLPEASPAASPTAAPLKPAVATEDPWAVNFDLRDGDPDTGHVFDTTHRMRGLVILRQPPEVPNTKEPGKDICEIPALRTVRVVLRSDILVLLQAKDQPNYPDNCPDGRLLAITAADFSRYLNEYSLRDARKERAAQRKAVMDANKAAGELLKDGKQK
jgi:hypothetical protein